MAKYSYTLGLQLKDSAERRLHCRVFEMGKQGVHFTLEKIKMITIKNRALAPFTETLALRNSSRAIDLIYNQAYLKHSKLVY